MADAAVVSSLLQTPIPPSNVSLQTPTPAAAVVVVTGAPAVEVVDTNPVEDTRAAVVAAVTSNRVAASSGKY